MLDSAMMKSGFELIYFGLEEVECKLIYVLDTFIMIFINLCLVNIVFECVKCLSLLINLRIDFFFFTTKAINLTFRV